MAIVFVGIDLAKNVFAVHGVNEAGRTALVRPAVPRAKLAEPVASLPPCTTGMKACSGARHWAREFQALGHTVRLMAPKVVAPDQLLGSRGKTNTADATTALAFASSQQRLSLQINRTAPALQRLLRLREGQGLRTLG